MWFQIDDQFTNNRKARALAEQALEGRLHGLAAIGLWTLSGSQCQASKTDGVVSRADLVRLTLNAGMADELSALLVDVGLWHAPGHRCERCPAVADGTYLFHDWFDLGYNTREQVSITERKRKELKDARIHAQVWARDCIDPANPTVGRCRYCAVEVKKKDTRSPDRRPNLDHVDPNRADGVRNIVLSCSGCNKHKGNRTPAEAGMTLLPAPREHTTPEVSPQRAAAGNVSPVTTDAETASQAATDAETHAGTVSAPTPSPTTAPAGTPNVPPHQVAADTVATTTDQTPTNTRPDTDHMNRGVPARGMRAGAGQAGSGQGEGLGRGQGKGLAGSPPPAPEPSSRRKRRRGKGRGKPQPPVTRTPEPTPTTPPTTEPVPPRWDAGEAPDVQVPGTLGSPWHGWTGPPSTVIDESTCPAHGLPDPCRKCIHTPGGSCG
ncbi:hypothetical protein I1A62_29965 [Rhodococcus sp. USK10]|uniref:HNH endonuclease domain-containing protein n=1 Tax=Rhodococcus sp. USK10 TaxID=2789739 RepID=UPI001C60381D|nr:HNH endonuclease domain-containing protein [Rhodococcus sp. USK10]QYB01461.1 hypothetical protein I1A62_29965 [Rhodococcus sp. USK10]